MKFLDRWFGSKSSENRDTSKLRDMLFSAPSGEDAQGFAKLCRSYQDAIISNFPSWQIVPVVTRENPILLQEYVNGLIRVATFFAEELGHPGLLNHLVGNEDSNPLCKWEQALQHAERLEENLRYADSAKDLEAILADLPGFRGTGAEHVSALAYGHLSRCYLQSGDVSKALPAAETALRLCREMNDEEGIPIYLRGLYEIHRYLGAGEAAAAYAEQLADVLEDQGLLQQATRSRKQAKMALAGEPLNRIVAEVDGRRFEIEEVPRLTEGRVQFVFERNRTSLHVADVLTERGNRLIAHGKYEDALNTLGEAAKADPYNPDPHYHMGLSLLHLKRYAEAVRSYESTEERAPGWFHCSAMHWLARQLAAESIEHEIFLVLRTLEDDHEMGVAEKVCLAEQVLATAPTMALIHLHYGMNLSAVGRGDEALIAYRKGLNFAEEPQTRARLLVNLALIDTSAYERRGWLEEAAASKVDLVAAATAFLCLRDLPPPVQ